MNGLNYFIERDVLATLSDSVITNEDSIKTSGEEITVHLVILGISDGWIRIRVPDLSPDNEFLPEILDTPNRQICLPLTAFTRFELI